LKPSLVTVLALAVCAFGCAGRQARLYPVCFYNAKPPQDQLQSQYIPRLGDALKLSVGGNRDVKFVGTADGRWFVATTTSGENKRLAETWPRLGCIGQATSGSQVHEEAMCVEYIRDFIAKQEYLQFGQLDGVVGDAGWNEKPGGQGYAYCDRP
jgi:hypothetical protein